MGTVHQNSNSNKYDEVSRNIPFQIADVVTKIEAENKKVATPDPIQSVSVADVPVQTADIVHHLDKIDEEKAKELEAAKKAAEDQKFVEKYNPRLDTPIQVADLLTRYELEHKEEQFFNFPTTEDMYFQREQREDPRKEMITLAPKQSEPCEMVVEQYISGPTKDTPIQIADVVRAIEETPLFDYVEEDISKYIPFQIADIVYRIEKDDEAREKICPVKYEVDKYQPRRDCPIQIADLIHRMKFGVGKTAEVNHMIQNQVVKITQEECKSHCEAREIRTRCGNPVNNNNRGNSNN